MDIAKVKVAKLSKVIGCSHHIFNCRGNVLVQYLKFTQFAFKWMYILHSVLTISKWNSSNWSRNLIKLIACNSMSAKAATCVLSRLTLRKPLNRYFKLIHKMTISCFKNSKIFQLDHNLTIGLLIQAV